MATGFTANLEFYPFKVLIAKPDGGARVEYTIQHIPGGDTNFCDVGGVLSEQHNLSLYFATAYDYNSLRLAVGQQGTLEYNGETYNNALLAELGRSWVNKDGATIADAVFIVP